jgi:hypothetical protein
MLININQTQLVTIADFCFSYKIFYLKKQKKIGYMLTTKKLIKIKKKVKTRLMIK